MIFTLLILSLLIPFMVCPSFFPSFSFPPSLLSLPSPSLLSLLSSFPFLIYLPFPSLPFSSLFFLFFFFRFLLSLLSYFHSLFSLLLSPSYFPLFFLVPLHFLPDIHM